MGNDPNKVYPLDATSPAKTYENVGASDTVNFPQLARAIRFDVSGIVTLVMSNGDTAVITAIAGETFAGNVKRVNETGSDAAFLVATTMLVYYS